MSEYLRVREAAEILAVSEATVRRMVKTGILQSVRVGRRSIRIPRASIKTFKGENAEREDKNNDKGTD